jgi:hypothetical protein
MPITYYTRNGAGTETALPATTRGTAPPLKLNLRIVTPPTGENGFAVGDGRPSNDSKMYTINFYLSAATPQGYQAAKEAMVTQLQAMTDLKVDWNGVIRYRKVLFVEISVPKTRTALGNSGDFEVKITCKSALWSSTFGGTESLASQ